MLPSLLLSLSLLPLPSLSTTTPGVTADLATGFEFLHSLIQHFFIDMAVLYIFLRLATALLRPDEEGRSLLNLNPVVSRPVLHTVNVVAAYMAMFVIVKGVLLEHFVVGALYSLCLILMTFPVPIYLTLRILKLSGLIEAVNDTARYADPEAVLKFEKKNPSPKG